MDFFKGFPSPLNFLLAFRLAPRVSTASILLVCVWMCVDVCMDVCVCMCVFVIVSSCSPQSEFEKIIKEMGREDFVDQLMLAFHQFPDSDSLPWSGKGT